MDSLTQIVLGAAVGEAVLGKKVGNKALLYGAIAGTIPDLDVLANFFTDTITAIELHRGFSHSIFFSVLMAPLFGVLVHKIEHKAALGWRAWALLFFWGMFTHPLLDAFTTWGTHLFWPLENRLAFNAVFVIDPLYTIPFLICTLLVLFFRRDSKIRRRINLAGLSISTIYLLSTLVIKTVVSQKFEAALKEQHINYLKLSTRPAPLNTILWNANVETADSFLVGDYSFFDEHPIRFTTYPKHREASRTLERYPNVQRLMAITQGWYIIEKKEGNWYFYDLRFGLIPLKDEPAVFAFTYLLKEEHGQIWATENKKTRRDAQFLFQWLWRRIKGEPLKIKTNKTTSSVTHHSWAYNCNKNS